MVLADRLFPQVIGFANSEWCCASECVRCLSTFAAMTATECSDIAAAVRAVVDAAPPLTDETVQRIGAIMRVPLSLPLYADPGGVEAQMSA